MPRDDAVHDAGGVGVVDRAEAQLVHDGDRAGAHRDDVAHDAADAGRGALERLDVARVVVRLDLEGDRPALADVDDAGVLAHADHEVLLHLVGDLLAELAQVDLARLVRAVLAPHDRVHRELGARGAAAEDVADALVLVGLEAQRGVRLLLLGRGCGVVDGIDGGGRGAAHAGGLLRGGRPDASSLAARAGPLGGTGVACRAWRRTRPSRPTPMSKPSSRRWRSASSGRRQSGDRAHGTGHGRPPVMWGTAIIGFGSQHYKGKSGREGDG